MRTLPMGLCALAWAAVPAQETVPAPRIQLDQESQPAQQVQQTQDTQERKKLLFLTHAGLYKHASLGTAEEAVTAWGPRRGFAVTTLQGYQQASDQLDLSVITADYLDQFDGVMFMTNGNLPLTPSQKEALVAFVRNGGPVGASSAHAATIVEATISNPSFLRMSSPYTCTRRLRASAHSLSNDYSVGDHAIRRVTETRQSRPVETLHRRVVEDLAEGAHRLAELLTGELLEVDAQCVRDRQRLAAPLGGVCGVRLAARDPNPAE